MLFYSRSYVKKLQLQINAQQKEIQSLLTQITGLLNEKADSIQIIGKVPKKGNPIISIANKLKPYAEITSDCVSITVKKPR